MKIAICSDLHLEFREMLFGNILSPKAKRILGFPEKLDADCLVIAGDLHPEKHKREKFIKDYEDHYGIPVLFVAGNHDYYGSDFPDDLGEIWKINGKTIAGTTLWTKLDLSSISFTRLMSDFAVIKNISIDKWNDLHHKQKLFLEKINPDVVITHHCPTNNHIHQKYIGNHLNRFFSSNIDMSPFTNCKLWISGHTHEDFDFVSNNIRFVVNPLGYPNEKFPITQVKIIDLT